MPKSQKGLELDQEEQNMKIALAADHAGFEDKEKLVLKFFHDDLKEARAKKQTH